MLSILFSLALSATNYTISVKLNDNGTVEWVNEFVNSADAWALFTDSYDDVDIGWGQIHIWTNSESPSYNQMYCAGFADTFVTKERVRQAFLLYREAQTGSKTGRWPASWTDWFLRNIQYMRRMTSHPADEYWERTRLILAQFDGMVDGYAAAKLPADVEISELDFWIWQSAGDIDDLETVLAGHAVKDPELTLRCTGLIKIAPNYEDVYFAQDTWSDYRDLHAYLKEYNLNIPEFKSHRVSLSTRTGHIASVDDFWTNDKGLLVLETTMHNWNQTLYDLYVKPESVLTWIRSYHAMFATEGGQEWTEHFIRENSGTYNNEYIVLDTKLFKPGEKPEKDLLWIIEQYPGIYRSKDITEELVNQTFFPSVNTPWFEDLFQIANYSGIQAADPQKAAFWSFYNQSRTKIIFRDAPNIASYQEFQKFMRYNDYLHDPLLQIQYLDQPSKSWSEPAQGILSRYDLRPKEGTPYGAKNHFGGIDSKTARVTEFASNYSWDAILSPENEANPAFDFNDWPEISHDGIRSKWEIKDYMKFQGLDYCAIYGGERNQSRCMEIPGCGFCIYSQECMLGEKSGPSNSLNKKCEDGWSTKTENPSYALPLVVSVTVIVVVFVCIIYASAYYAKIKKSKKVQYQSI
ncbi:Phospholipase B-like protein B [Tritrichomonas foetus]|uniref:Phospholipase B-like n=1 Tax=Tritrichomonas foetus TaxID=1144522 RepID=A0A1J4JC15_9EUKA|nr:Phospholipase B-like protein B [Tritrichomonas foetus]|eukprot:OHS95791.1 Phospholipase B-like protein B [Tritrichomonas foetus]